MKSNFMKALMAVAICLTMAIPDAKASDWSNGEITCQFQLNDTPPLYEFWNWGKWGEITLRYRLLPNRVMTQCSDLSVFPGKN